MPLEKIPGHEDRLSFCHVRPSISCTFWTVLKTVAQSWVGVPFWTLKAILNALLGGCSPEMSRNHKKPCAKTITTFAHYLYVVLHRARPHYNTLQHTTTHYNTLQHTTTHYNTLQHTTFHCITFHCHCVKCWLKFHVCLIFRHLQANFLLLNVAFLLSCWKFVTWTTTESHMYRKSRCPLYFHLGCSFWRIQCSTIQATWGYCDIFSVCFRICSLSAKSRVLRPVSYISAELVLPSDAPNLPGLHQDCIMQALELDSLTGSRLTQRTKWSKDA